MAKSATYLSGYADSFNLTPEMGRSSYQPGKLANFTDAAKYLFALKSDDVLELISQGAGNKASRYRYVWPE